MPYNRRTRTALAALQSRAPPPHQMQMRHDNRTTHQNAGALTFPTARGVRTRPGAPIAETDATAHRRTETIPAHSTCAQAIPGRGASICPAGVHCRPTIRAKKQTHPTFHRRHCQPNTNAKVRTRLPRAQRRRPAAATRKLQAPSRCSHTYSATGAPRLSKSTRTPNPGTSGA